MIYKLLDASLPIKLDKLGYFLTNLDLRTNPTPQKWSKAQNAVMTAISRYREEIISVASSQSIEIIEGHRTKILEALETKNIHVLPGGTIERYLPHYQGNEFQLTQEAKNTAILEELDYLVGTKSEEELASRYTELYDAIKKVAIEKLR